jgi:hypothetical protein
MRKKKILLTWRKSSRGAVDRAIDFSKKSGVWSDIIKHPPAASVSKKSDKVDAVAEA